MSTENLPFIVAAATAALGIAGVGASMGQRMAASAGSLLMADKPERFGISLILTVIVETSAIYGLLVAILILARLNSVSTMRQAVAALAAGLSVGVSGFTTGIGEGVASTASIGAIAEREGVFGKTLVLTVLPETGAIYGLLTAVLILRGAGFLGGVPDIPENLDTAAIYASLVICATSICSYLQGRVGASAISAVAKREEAFGRDIIFVVLLESVLIYGLLIAILILRFNAVI